MVRFKLGKRKGKRRGVVGRHIDHSIPLFCCFKSTWTQVDNANPSSHVCPNENLSTGYLHTAVGGPKNNTDYCHYPPGKLVAEDATHLGERM